MKVYRNTQNGVEKVFNIMSGVYSGKDMGERSISTTIEFPAKIDFKIGDYVEFDIANLIRGINVEGGHNLERFYLYDIPTVKKTARPLTSGDAFEQSVVFYPAQHELTFTMMRDILQEQSAGVIYTGFDNFTFYGGANALMKRIIAVLRERFGAVGTPGVDFWDYQIADSINEDRNDALEKYQFEFSGNTVWDALMKLNDESGINTKFWINGRMIYVGYKRPYITGVDDSYVQRTIPFEFRYGKTSHLPIGTNHGGLIDITKSTGPNQPITRLYAYGSNRNLNRFYCSDRVKSGRYVNKLMLPMFSNDGHTDYIDSVDGIKKFGVREGMHSFDEIYPSLRYFTYGDIRKVKYCIKIMGSGLESDSDGVYEQPVTLVNSELSEKQRWNIKTNKEVTTESGTKLNLTNDVIERLESKGVAEVQTITYPYPIARVQCYRVEELPGTQVNHLVPSAPPVDIAVFCRATGKVVKCILYADKEGVSSIDRQGAADGQWDNGNYKIPAKSNRGNDYIVGSCFAVHDENYPCAHVHGKYKNGMYDETGTPLTRSDWFINPDSVDVNSSKTDPTEKRKEKEAKEKYRNEIEVHQINYTDTHWISDIFEFEAYDQQTFNREGYSAYCWPRINRTYPDSQADYIELNSVVAVKPVVVEDTDLNVNVSGEGRQATFDIYLRDIGFKINEQTWFGDRVFLFSTCTINFLDGALGGCSFNIPSESDTERWGEIIVPALLEDGNMNPAFFTDEYAEEAYLNGAYWRIVLTRAETDIANYWLPNININASAGDKIVLLDIYMPDIYVRVAEQRLLREAQKFLDNNDDGEVQYAVNIDEVKMLQIHQLALQMREGAIMRLADDDLEVSSINDEKLLFDDKNGLVSTQSLVTVDSSIDRTKEVVERNEDYLFEKGMSWQKPKFLLVKQPDGSHKKRIVLEQNVLASDIAGYFDEESVTICMRTKYRDGSYSNKFYNTIRPEFADRIEYWDGHQDVELIASTDGRLVIDDYKSNLADDSEYICLYKVAVGSVSIQTTSQVLPPGYEVLCQAGTYIDFQAKRYYEVTIDVLDSAEGLAVYDELGKRTLFALSNGLGNGMTSFVPEYNIISVTPLGEYGYKRFVIGFYLDSDFNDSIPYYPSIRFRSDGITPSVVIRLWSVKERYNQQEGDIPFVDLSIESITIDFHDNTREYGVSLQNGLEPSRLTRVPSIPMQCKISAVVKEETHASSWSQMQNDIHENEILTENNTVSMETKANEARNNYQKLDRLKNTIFDPDGSCNSVFMQTMMMQIGPNSMNYQLLNTRQSVTGSLINCIIERPTGTELPERFLVINDDILEHFAITDTTGGRWYIPGNASFELNPLDDGTHQPYFICIKCSKSDSRDAMWICSDKQYLYDEDPNYYYFNWGVLMWKDDVDGYQLVETRGNAYMYGDNVVCGVVKTMDGGSYLDLNHNVFHLGDKDGSGALHYENGKLTIEGANKRAGGENLYLGEYISRFEEGYRTSIGKVTLQKDESLVISWDKLSEETQAYDEYMQIRIVHNGVEVVSELVGASGKYEYAYKATENGEYEVFLTAGYYTHYVTIYGLMLQIGESATGYQTATKHITDAIHGSTKIDGGLLMTRVLELENENDETIAGMSGLQGTPDNPENVGLWFGGTYEDAVKQANGLVSELAKLLPVLITKNGAGSRIGCLEVVDEKTVKIAYNNRSIVLGLGDTDPYISMQVNNVEVARYSTEKIDENEIEYVRLYGEKIFEGGSRPVFENGIANLISFDTNNECHIRNNASRLRITIFSGVRYANGYEYKFTGNLSIDGRRSFGNINIQGYVESSSTAGADITIECDITFNEFIFYLLPIGSHYFRIENASFITQNTAASDWIENIDNISIKSIEFIDGGSIDIHNMSNGNKMRLGSNGIEVTHTRGGLIQILNGNDNMPFVRMAGLPMNGATTKRCQLCEDNDGHIIVSR